MIYFDCAQLHIASRLNKRTNRTKRNHWQQLDIVRDEWIIKKNAPRKNKNIERQWNWRLCVVVSHWGYVWDVGTIWFFSFHTQNENSFSVICSEMMSDSRRVLYRMGIKQPKIHMRLNHSQIIFCLEGILCRAIQNHFFLFVLRISYSDPSHATCIL